MLINVKLNFNYWKSLGSHSIFAPFIYSLTLKICCYEKICSNDVTYDFGVNGLVAARGN